MNLPEICQQLDWRIVIFSYIVNAMFEAWLGKTEKVKSGSVLELIWNLILSIGGKK